MKLHGNAKLCPSSRVLLVRRVLEEHWKIAEVAAAFGISERTAYRWLSRWRGGDRALMDRSSRPHRSPRRTPRRLERLIEQLRRLRMTSTRIAVEVRVDSHGDAAPRAHDARPRSQPRSRAQNTTAGRAHQSVDGPRNRRTARTWPTACPDRSRPTKDTLHALGAPSGAPQPIHPSHQHQQRSDPVDLAQVYSSPHRWEIFTTSPSHRSSFRNAGRLVGGRSHRSVFPADIGHGADKIGHMPTTRLCGPPILGCAASPLHGSDRSLS